MIHPTKWDWYWSLGVRDYPTIRLSIFLRKWGCWGHWGHWGCWGCRGRWGCRCLANHFWGLQSHPGPWVQLFLMFWKKKMHRTMKHHFGSLPPFLSEAVEASWCYFFKNWLMKLKCPNLLKPLDTIIQENCRSFYPSETFRIPRFNMKHPV